jgi:hypothetical protein
VEDHLTLCPLDVLHPLLIYAGNEPRFRITSHFARIFGVLSLSEFFNCIAILDVHGAGLIPIDSPKLIERAFRSQQKSPKIMFGGPPGRPLS